MRVAKEAAPPQGKSCGGRLEELHYSAPVPKRRERRQGASLGDERSCFALEPEETESRREIARVELAGSAVLVLTLVVLALLIIALTLLIVGGLVQKAVTKDGSPLEGRDTDEVMKLISVRRGPERMLDLMLRTGPYGLTLDELEANPHGIDLGPLEPRLPDALRDPAVRLAVDDQRIDSATHIIDSRMLDDAQRAEFGLDLDLAHMASIGKPGGFDGLVALALERTAQLGRKVRALPHGERHIE